MLGVAGVVDGRDRSEAFKLSSRPDGGVVITVTVRRRR